MALTDSSIKTLQDAMASSSSTLKSFEKQKEQCSNQLRNNDNYTIFSTSVAEGIKINEQFRKVEEIADKVAKNMEDLIRETNSFLIQQSSINSSRRSGNKNMGNGAIATDTGTGVGGPGPSTSAINYATDPRFRA